MVSEVTSTGPPVFAGNRTPPRRRAICRSNCLNGLLAITLSGPHPVRRTARASLDTARRGVRRFLVGLITISTWWGRTAQPPCPHVYPPFPPGQSRFRRRGSHQTPDGWILERSSRPPRSAAEGRFADWLDSTPASPESGPGEIGDPAFEGPDASRIQWVYDHGLPGVLLRPASRHFFLRPSSTTRIVSPDTFVTHVVPVIRWPHRNRFFRLIRCRRPGR